MASPRVLQEVHEGRESVSEYDSWSDLGKNYRNITVPNLFLYVNFVAQGAF